MKGPTNKRARWAQHCLHCARAAIRCINICLSTKGLRVISMGARLMWAIQDGGTDVLKGYTNATTNVKYERRGCSSPATRYSPYPGRVKREGRKPIDRLPPTHLNIPSYQWTPSSPGLDAVETRAFSRTCLFISSDIHTIHDGVKQVAPSKHCPLSSLTLPTHHTPQITLPLLLSQHNLNKTN